MKKILFLAAATLLAAVSCNKELEAPAVSENNAPSEFIATVEGGQDSKTVLGEIDKVNGTKLYWNGDESILAFGADWTEKSYTAKGLEKQSTATFVEDNVEETLKGENYIVVTPCLNRNPYWAGGDSDPLHDLWLSDFQKAIVGTYDPSAHIAVAKTTSANNSLSFKNVNALVGVTAAEEGITGVRFYKEGKALSGNFNVKFDDSGNPKVDLTNRYPKSYVVLTGNLENGQDYFISTLSNVELDGFTIEFDKDGKVYRRTTDKSLNLERNKVVGLGSLSTENYTELTETYRTLYLKALNYWGDAGAVPWAYLYSNNSGRSQWVSMNLNSDGLYECKASNDFTTVIFCRMNPAGTSENMWDNKWTQLADAMIPADEAINCYVATSESLGEWKKLDDVLGAPEPVYPSVIYFKPNSGWPGDYAKFAAWSWGGTASAWIDITEMNEDGVYTVNVPNGNTTLFFLRLSSSHTAGEDWSAEWNRSTTEMIPTDGRNLFILNEGSWGEKETGNGGNGTWSTL